jgi:hypothetical protein
MAARSPWNGGARGVPCLTGLEAVVTGGRCHVTRSADHLRQALALYRHADALGLAIQIHDAYQQARAHHGVGTAHQATGDPGQACRHWRQALTIYTNLGTPEAEEVRAQLRTLNTTM